MATIYKILSPCLRECYVGSTIRDVEKRWQEHMGKQNTTLSRGLFEQYGEDCKFVVLEVCPLEERFIKEQWWLEHAVGAVNAKRAITSAEVKRAQHKVYREANLERLTALDRTYREAHREKKNASQRAYREAHREVIATYHRAYYIAKKNTMNPIHNPGS